MNRRQNKKSQIARSKIQPQKIHPHPQGLPDGVTLHVASKQETYSGPLPHPDHLLQFEAIEPGITNRLMLMIEREQEASNTTVSKQLEIHEKVIGCTAKDNARAQYVALSALALCLAASVALAFLHAKAAASIVGGTTVMGVVGTFIRGKVKEKPKKT